MLEFHNQACFLKVSLVSLDSAVGTAAIAVPDAHATGGDPSDCGDDDGCGDEAGCPLIGASCSGYVVGQKLKLFNDPPLPLRVSLFSIDSAVGTAATAAPDAHSTGGDPIDCGDDDGCGDKASLA
mmetsp:Transcript_54480/g.176260  ORF Transcript_54480/g.176260 Transcript_54480/m.176260 type:complete len:125 (+) Transcript_54480:109-483(+)